eukprot:10703393-Ditylum_brightwellii.AAC.1
MQFPVQPPSVKGEVLSSDIYLPLSGEFTHKSKVGDDTKDVHEKLCSFGEEVERTPLDNNEVKQMFVSNKEKESTSKDVSQQD